MKQRNEINDIVLGNIPQQEAFALTPVVHGFNVDDDGEATVDKIIPYIEQYWHNKAQQEGEESLNETLDHNYGHFGLMQVIFRNSKVAMEVVDSLSYCRNQWCNEYGRFFAFDQYAVGHSNGCAIIVEAAKQGATFKRVLLINPALPIDTRFPDSMGEVIVVHTKHDKATRAARIGNMIPFLGLVVPDAWGAMGTKGALYCNNPVTMECFDARVTNIDLTNWVGGHSTIFTYEGQREAFLPTLVEALYEGVSRLTWNGIAENGVVLAEIYGATAHG